MSRTARTQAGLVDDRFTIRDRAEIERLRRTIRRRKKAGRPVSKLETRLGAQVAAAEQRMAARRATRLELEYPDELPISRARGEILEALAAHRVVVVCGDTGSGKTTQLPKICLEAGRGIAGMIGHTQPRRLAAHSVASRLAFELGTDVGTGIGVKVRFSDSTSPNTLVKVMTDGILLNEIRGDRALEAYDTIIIDEAHERSLDIDFLLGYLKRLLERRDDLKVLVTSATIDPERFAAHFGGAPVIRVEGRTFPVEIRYRPRARDTDIADAVVEAVNALAHEDLEPLGGGDARDVLVFLPGERWIREAEAALERVGPRGYEILPLYARLNAEQQQRIFAPGREPRIVLATNIAETSLTVPRIRFVVDAGLARISRYQPRHRVQRLAVEPIAQANAAQRAGRCGRLAPGICVRLYSESDFEQRPAFTPAETLRTNLAGVILRLEAMRLGHVADFPFLDAPPAKAVNDGYRLLHVLGALDEAGELTADGEAMGRLPIDPRLGRLLLAAGRNGSLPDALVVAAVLSVPDPREQRPDARASARGRDANGQATRDRVPRSDFEVWIELWRAYRRERRKGAKAFRAWCKRESLSPARLGEWADVHAQLVEIATDLERGRGAGGHDANALPRAVLAAFVDYVFERTEGSRYRGVHDASARLFPGSALASKPPRWIVAAEHVALAEPYLRSAVKIDPRWVPVAAPHLVSRDYVEPRWDRERGRVLAREIVTLMGLKLGAGRLVDFGEIDARRARELFIRDALAADDLGADPGFLVHNRAVRRTVLDWEARRRSRDLFVGDRAFEAHYGAWLPERMSSRRALMRWSADPDRDARLRLDVEDVVTAVPAPELASDYPDTIECAAQPLKLDYRYDPSDERDGVTVRVPAMLVESLRADELDWIVPGWLEAKVLGLLRTLPKEARRPLVPLPDTAAALVPTLRPETGRRSLVDALAAAIAERFGLAIDTGAFRLEQLARHLFMRIEVVDENGTVMAAGRDLRALQSELTDEHSDPGRSLPSDPVVEEWTARGLKIWPGRDLPEHVTLGHGQRYAPLVLYPALIDVGGRVDLTLLPPGPVAVERHRRGVRRLFVLGLPQQVGVVRDRVRADKALQLGFLGIGTEAELVDDLLLAAADECFETTTPIRRRAEFERSLAAGRAGFVAAAERLLELLRELVEAYRGLKRRLESPAVPLPETARADIEAQLAGLIRPHMLSETPLEWRARLPRYLAAIDTRLDKLEQRHPKDAESQARVTAARQRLEAWRAHEPPDWPLPAPVARYLWLIEEFRISLFAQALGTVEPVSEKRLEHAWHDAVAAGRGAVDR